MRSKAAAQDRQHVRWMRWQIAMHRAHATRSHRLAWWAARAGLSGRARYLRHESRQSLRMAIKMERGLATGAYRLGRRMFPAVEDQCGCAEYCQRDRS